MVLRLQSVLTLYLSVVLAFLGLWWYTSWKKERLADKDGTNEETTKDQEQLSSYPIDVGNCVVENGHSTGMHMDRHAVRERLLVEQELVDSTNTPAAAELGTVPLCQSQPEVRVMAADCLGSDLDTAAVKPITESTESSAQVFPETASESQAQGGPENDLALQRKHQPSSRLCDLGSGKSNVCSESAGINPQPPPPSETLEDTTNSTLNQETAEVRLDPEGEVRLDPEGEVRLDPEGEVRLDPEGEVRLDPEGEVRLDPEGEVRLDPEGEVRLDPEGEVRLDPEGEVRLDPEGEVRLDPEGEVRLDPEGEVRLDPEGEVRLDPEGEVRLDPEGEVRLDPEGEVRLDPEGEVRLDPAGEVRLDPAGEVRLDPEGEVRLDPEGEVGEDKMSVHFAEVRLQTNLAKNSLFSKDILPAPPNKQSGVCLKADVVSAAVSQFLKEKTLLGHSVSPLRSRDPCKAPDHISMDNSEPESEMPPLLQEDQCSTTGRESPIVQEDVKHDRSSTVEIETEKTELAKEDSAVGDSGSSSGQTEEGSSGKDLSTSVSLQPPRVPAEGLGATSMSFTNGHRMEEVDIPGSDVNSMDCVDSYCEHEARDNKHSNSPSPPSQLLNTDQAIVKYIQSHNSSQPLTVWEIEVPKHFVGRLIGKKGRYVNYLKETSGATVFITALPYTQEFHICHTEGSKEQVYCALELIRKKFKDLDVTNLCPTSSGQPAPSLHHILGSEVILENIAPLPGEEFSALEEMTQGLALLAQVTNCHTSGIPLVQIWRTEGEE
ncbi:unnamed protein product, partial [Coregonus sp. 'balchen']